MSQHNLRNAVKENKFYIQVLAIYTFLFLFFCSKMSPLYPINDWADINVYFNVGKGIFSGMTLYSEIFDHKGPLVFFIYGLASLISGDSFLGVFIFQILLWILAIWAVYFTAKLFLKSTYAMIVALLIPISFLAYMANGGSAEEMIMLLAIISLYFFIAYFKQADKHHKPIYMLFHGIITAMVLFIKLNLILFWFFPLLAIFVGLLVNKEFKNFFANCAAYIAGVAIVAIPVCAYFIYNGALGEAYHVYIELNKQYSSTDNYSYLITNGFSKLYKEFRLHLVWYLIISLGIFYFPLKFLKNKLAIVALILSGVVMFLIIFFPLTFHFYYPLPLFLFTSLGLIVIMDFVSQQITINASNKLIYMTAFVLLIVGINQRNFFGLGAETLLRQRDPDGPQFVFKDIIKAEKNATLLNLAFDQGNALFTTTNTTPTVKYFFCPNIYYNMYPDIRDNQAKYIEQKETMFVIDCNTGFNYDFFLEFEPLKNNYSMIDSLVLYNDYVNNRFKTFYLYKRNDQQ